MGYQQSVENNFMVLARLERAETGGLAISSLGTPTVMAGKTMESVLPLAGRKEGVTAHCLVPNWPFDFVQIIHHMTSLNFSF